LKYISKLLQLYQKHPKEFNRYRRQVAEKGRWESQRPFSYGFETIVLAQYSLAQAKHDDVLDSADHTVRRLELRSD